MDDEGNGEHSEQVRGALLKAVAVVVGIGVVIAIGTTVVVRALGLNEGGSAGPVGSAPAAPATPLPTTAVPVPAQETPSALPSPVPSASAGSVAGRGDIQLNLSPLRASPMERVNLTGTYPGADNVPLEVQRFDTGQWRSFGVSATVRVGTYATYVQTGQGGEQRFRMFDPQTHKGSNVEMVTIG